MKLTRNARKLVALTLSAALVLGGVAVNGSSASAAKKATLKLSKKSAKLTVGKKLTLKVTKKNVKSAKITWKSSKKSVASVSKKGVVKAKKAGKTKISATIKYKAKGSKKTQKKTLKCTVTVTKKAVVASKAPAPTKAPDASKAPDATEVPTNTPGGDASNPSPTPGTSDPTPTPGGSDPTPTPGASDPTSTPGTSDSTPTPGTSDPTPTPGASNPTPTPDASNPTPVPNPVQSLKITVKDGETVLKDAVVTIKNSADQAVTATKGEDGSYTTDKLVAGKYTISVAELAVDAGKYTAISKEVNIAENPTNEVQEVAIAMVLALEDEEIYTSTAGLFVDAGYKAIQPGYKYKEGYSSGKWDADIEEDTGNDDNKKVTYDFTNIKRATFKISYTLKADVTGYYFQMNGKDLTLLKDGDVEKNGTIVYEADINTLQNMAGNGINFGGKGIYVHKITITVQERYEGAYMHMFVGDEITDQMTGILANGQYTFTFTSDTPVTITESGYSNRKALYIKCYDALPAGVKITVDKVTMDDTEYTVDKLSEKLYKDGVAQDIVTSVNLKDDGAIWYNGWDNPVTAPDGFTATEISKTSITITVTGFPEK